MNPTEAAELLGHAAAFDNRKPSTAAAIAWASALHNVPLDADAKAAVAAYYTTPPQDPNAKLWILPHHVRTLRTKIRNARLENFQYEPLPNETTREYLARYRGQVAAIASGRAPAPTQRPALEGGPSKTFMRELEAHGWQGTRPMPDDEPLQDAVRRSGPLGIQCPTCAAEIGRPCKTGRGTKKHPLGVPLARPHTARRRAAAGEPLTTPGIEDEAAQRRAAAAAHLASLTDAERAQLAEFQQQLRAS
ncbi:MULTISPECIES: zinc finger domain-containing protein [Streptomyces]|uniref:DNA-binding phage zinc finger domain-containing protein n=1 Tax=Streptomyces fradiae ATCC 10745 = DSM 40063 TaxID=1319510 RepID=A0A1Y2NSY2_STRFR|nr:MULTISPECIES: hypothetical protein [Streptomyces]KAF0647133.1 hypothetical protein K701_25435 [Streptomyces fradiae ATCC 10745 = DSM 40063]OSY50440.1 hypothetical protein BG846_03918 [Streptomyces fradiae ATCC 10745 = DSM 40063]QEV12049.1 hypothetical protein CP974_08475 [Streptomyces fradiae ATCC 10745 = DSM 40063]